MWGNITGVVGAAISKAKQLQTELESQLDAAVNADGESEDPAAMPRNKTNQMMLGDYMIDSYDEDLAAPAALGAVQAAEDDDSLTDVPLPESPEKRNIKKSIGSSDNQDREISQLKEELSISKAETKKYAKLLSDETLKCKKNDDDMRSLQIKCSADMDTLERNLNNIKTKMVDKYEAEIKSLKDEILAHSTSLSRNSESMKLSGEYKSEIEKLEKLLEEKDSAHSKIVREKEIENGDKLSNEIKNITNMFDSEISELKLLISKNEKSFIDEMKVSKTSYEKKIEDIRKDHKIALDEAAERAAAVAATSGNDALAAETATRRILEGERDELKVKLLEMTSLEDVVTKKNTESAALIESLKKKLRDLEDNNKKLSADLKKKDDEVISLKKKKDASEKKDKGASDGAHKKAIEDRDKSISERDSLIKELEVKLSSYLAETESLKKTVADSLSNNESASALAHAVSEKDEIIAKKDELIVEREKALENYSIKMAEFHQSVETLQSQIADYKSQIQDLQTQVSSSQQSASSDVDLRKQLLKLQETIRDKNEKLVAFESEGQALAKKQSEMEKVVRTTKKEMKGKETEIANLKEGKEQLAKVINEMQELVRSKESDASNASKSLSVMQAVSQASTDKLTKVESDLSGKIEEISNLKRALDTAWSENNEIKRSAVELRADRDDLKRQLGEGTSRVIETESSRRDIEQREAVLRATNKQLQDSLQRQMSDSSAREERLRDEVADMRSRWNDAVANRDSLAGELGNAAAPLLRQITSLQDAMRTKSEAWQGIESTLSERALRAENAAEVADHRRGILDEQVIGLKTQLSSALNKNNEYQSVITNNDFTIEKYKKQDTQNIEKISDLESRLSLEMGQKSSLQASLRELEMRFKIEQQDSRDAIERSKKSFENQISLLKLEIENLTEQKIFYEKNRPPGMAKDSHPPADALVGSDISDISGSSSSSNSVNKMKFYLSTSLPDTLPSGEASYAASQRLQRERHHKADEVGALQLQVSQLQASRDALLDEVSYLSSKNAELEERVQSLPSLSKDFVEARRKIDVLLALLGEKGEEYEALQADIKEVKFLYRAQLDELLLRVDPEGTSSS